MHTCSTCTRLAGSIIPSSQAHRFCNIGPCIYHLQCKPRLAIGCFPITWKTRLRGCSFKGCLHKLINVLFGKFYKSLGWHTACTSLTIVPTWAPWVHGSALPRGHGAAETSCHHAIKNVEGLSRKHVCEPFNVRTPRRSNQPDAPARRKGITDRLHIRFTAIVSQLVDPIHYGIGAMLQGNPLSRWNRQLGAAVENCQVRQSSMRPCVANAFCAGIFGGDRAGVRQAD